MSYLGGELGIHVDYIGEVLNILRKYKTEFHEIYTKGLKYRRGGRIEVIYHTNSMDLFVVKGELSSYWVCRINGDFYCSCPDFFYNIVMRRDKRKFCAHIIACMILLVDRQITKKLNYGESREVILRHIMMDIQNCLE